MFGRKRNIQWKLIEGILIENSDQITNSEMWKVVIYLPIEKGTLYKSEIQARVKKEKEDKKCQDITLDEIYETIEEEYFIIPTAMLFLQDKLVG